jgi:hypothetical protein
MNGIYIFIIILIIVLILLYSKKNGFGENFKVLGALGPYKKDYAQCLRNCETDDPTLYLSNDKLTCGEFCDSLFTQLSRENAQDIQEKGHEFMKSNKLCGKPYYNQHDTCNQSKPAMLFNDKDYCKDKCGEDLDCNRRCVCKFEVMKSCAENCKYSSLPTDQCMEYCALRTSLNCQSGAWQFRM